MAITAQSIVDQARTLLHDTNAATYRWADAEFLVWVNAGRRDMAAAKPTLWGTTAKRTVTLGAGCYQSLPSLSGVADAFSLVDVLNNVSATNVVGDVIRNTTRAQLDTFNPSWKTETGAAVQNWFKDEANSLGFWVYPAVSGGKIDINVSVTPNDLGNLTQTAVPLDVMATTLLHYLMYRAYAKDAEIAQNAQLSANYLQLFVTAVGGA